MKKILFFENNDKSYTMVDLYTNDRFLGYKDSYNYYNIDVDNILLFEKSNNIHITRYNDLNKMKVVPLQIHSDDKELFRKVTEIWNKLIELIGINNAEDYVKNTADDDVDEFITVDVPKNIRFVKGNYRNKLVIVLHSVINDYLQTSLIQAKIHKWA